MTACDSNSPSSLRKRPPVQLPWLSTFSSVTAADSPWVGADLPGAAAPSLQRGLETERGAETKLWGGWTVKRANSYKLRATWILKPTVSVTDLWETVMIFFSPLSASVWARHAELRHHDVDLLCSEGPPTSSPRNDFFCLARINFYKAMRKQV